MKRLMLKQINRSVGDSWGAGCRARLIQPFKPGASTAGPSNVSYRLGKIAQLGIVAGRWLDCGCADGGYTVALAELGATQVVGIDILQERIALARERARAHPAVTFLHVAPGVLPFAPATFDGILLNEVLEHVTDEVQMLQELHRLLRPGGYLVVMSPNRWFPFEGHGMRIGHNMINIPIPLLPWIPAIIARHFMRARNYWPHELRELIRSTGFTIHSTGFVFPVFEVYPWLPAPVIRHYRRLVPILERTPVIRRFGVSNFIVARKPPVSEQLHSPDGASC